MGEAGADVVGVDWRTPLEQAIPLVGDRAVQGNLDPTLVFAPTEVMTQRAAEIIDADDKVVSAVLQRGRPRGSDTPVESRWWQVLTFRDGGLARVEMFSRRAEALEAAGLSE